MVCPISSVTQAGLGEGSPLSGSSFGPALFVSGGVFPSGVSGRAPGQCEIRCNEWCRGVDPGGDAVPDVSKLFGEHYCCELAILTFAGKDASEEFNMMHPPDVIDKYAPDVVIGILGGAGVAVAHGGGGAAAQASKDKGSVVDNIKPGATWMAQAIGT